MSLYQSNPKKHKPGFVPWTSCPNCGADLAVHGMKIPGQDGPRCRLCHAKSVASPRRVQEMHNARWGQSRKPKQEQP